MVTPYNQEEKSKKEQVESMFDNIAHRYDFLNHLLSAGMDILWRKKAIRFLAPFEPKVIMDMATGTGDFAFEALSLKPQKIIAYDLSANMISYGVEKAKKMGVSDIVEFVKGDSEEIPFKEEMFDAMTVGFGVRNFENLEKGLSEMHRILKSGGHLVVLEIAKPSGWIKPFFKFYFHYFSPWIGKLFSNDNRAYKYLPESVEVFPEGLNFVKILEKVGFEEVTYSKLSFGICAMYTCAKKSKA